MSASAVSEPFRIVLFGPESTGKTSLARALADRLGEPWSPEYVRSFWDEHAGLIGPDDLESVARGQIAAEDSATRSARRHVILDTDLLSCTVWDDLLFPGNCPGWVRVEAERRAAATTLFLLCLTDIPFEPDPQRCFPDPEGRAMCMRVFRDTLRSRGLRFVEVSGALDQRLETALSAVAALS